MNIQYPSGGYSIFNIEYRISNITLTSVWWFDHYKNVFSQLKYSPQDCDKITSTMYDIVNDQSIVSENEIIEAISELSSGKSPEVDNLSGEHLKYAGDRLPFLLAVLFTSMFVHGYMPRDMVKSVVVPVVKAKTKSISNKSNYRPITLATVISKLLEKIIHTRLEPYLFTSGNQFGFKKHHGTDLCIFVLKEVTRYYVKHGSHMLCFYVFWMPPWLLII